MTGYFDLAAANDRLADLRPLLGSLRSDRDAIASSRLRLERLRTSDGDLGGQLADHHAELERVQQDVLAVAQRMAAAVRQIDAWGVTLRDIGTGLVDFPALASGRPIWLCWRLGEGDIAWWHELATGLAGRKPLIELE